MEHFLHFTKSERIGILVLMVICIVLAILPAYLPDRNQVDPTDFTEFKQDIDRWYAGAENEITKNKEKQTKSVAPARFNPNMVNREQLQAHSLPSNTIRAWLSYTKKGGRFNTLNDLKKFRALKGGDLEKLKPFLNFEDRSTPFDEKTETPSLAEVSYFQFDPNTVSKKELIKLGIPEKTAKGWTNYTAKGGFFKKPSDIQKIYGLSSSNYERLLPYVEIPEVVNSKPIAADDAPKSYEYTQITIDINQSTPEQWQQLRGIGPAFSTRIVNFRSKLGGFHSVAQVAKTYGLPDSVFQKIQLSLRPSPLLRKLAINHLTEEELAAHPYLRYNDAKVIVQYRNNHGRFSNSSDLEKLYALDAATIKKIIPYLSFE